MSSLKFKNYINPKRYLLAFCGCILSIFILLFSIITLLVRIEIENVLMFIFGVLFLCISILISSLNFEIEIFKDFNNNKNILLFNKRISGKEIELLYPSYISLFTQKLKDEELYSQSIGVDTSESFHIIRFFDKNNRNEIIFKSKNKSEVLEKGKQLATLLNVELVNKLQS